MKIEKRIGAALTASALAFGLFASPLESVPLSLGTTVSAQEQQEQIVSAYISAADMSALPDSRELEEAYINSLFYGGGFSFYKDYGKTYLAGRTQALAIYNTLRTEIEEIAAGNRTSTKITFSFTDGATVGKDFNDAVDCLLVDLPASFYWYDKTVGVGNLTSSGNTFTVPFPVVEGYAAGDCTVNSQKIKEAQKSAANAQAIADANVGKTDYEKILAFREEICALTDYNDDALADGTPYGDPWQLVWVFDDDPNTKVVCEGYSKAFQYLCDLSGIECYTVSGKTVAGDGAGPHMWNIVVLGDESYLVDITNSDSRSIGKNGELLLKGAGSSDGTGCIFTNTNPDMSYTYDAETHALYDSAGILTVSTNDYEPPVHEHDWATEWSSDETGHWHACKDTTCKEQKDFAAHTPGDEATEDDPQLCTVCKYEIAPKLEHTHVWSTELKSDETGHWYPCTKCDTGKDSFAEHTETAGSNGVEVTCTTDGRKADTVCSVCGYIIKNGEIIPKTGHTPGESVQENVVGATCTTKGSYDEVVYCENCDEELSRKKVTDAMRPHETEEVAGTAKEATCGEAGKEADKQCKNCDYTEEGAEIPATGKHTAGDPVRDNEVAATCYKEGSYDEIIKCTVCDYIMSTEKKTVEKIAHTPGTPEKKNEVPATCTRDGSYDMVTKCAVAECGAVITTEHTVVPALGHDFSPLVQGETTHYQECSRCHTKAGEAAHIKDSGTVTITPTAENTGVRTYSCTVCGKVLDTEIIPKLEADHAHSYTIKNSDGSSHWNECVCGEKDLDSIAAHTEDTKEEIALAAVCNVDGLKYVITYCTDCDRVISRVPTVIPKTGEHTASADYGKDSTDHWNICINCGTVINKAPHEAGPAATETTPQTCTVCGYEIAPVLAHTHVPSDAWRFDSTGHWHDCASDSCDAQLNYAVHTEVSETAVAPTATVPGTRRYYCSVCRYVIREEVIPATGVTVQPETPTVQPPSAPVIPIWINSNTDSAEPVLDNGSGKSGWRSIARDIKNASSGDTVYVDMNGTTKLSKTALKELMGKNVDLVLEMSGDITWTINGETVTKTSDVNMAAKLNTNNIPGKVTEKLSEDGKVVQVSLSHSGNFGFDAVMTVYLGAAYNGKYANLMYYNPASGAAEFVDCSLITGGRASLDFTHASEYAIVISDEPMGAYEDVSAAAGAFESGVNVSSAAYVSIIAVIAAAMVIFRKKARK